jgi:hypothetical protein
MTCTISGVLRNLNGDVLPNATMRITRRSGVVGIGDAVVIPNTVDVTADGIGAVSFDAYPGEYDGRIFSDFGGSGPFLIGVPDEATADLDDLIDQGAGALTPELVQRAEDAADRAEDAANYVVWAENFATLQAAVDFLPARGGVINVRSNYAAATAPTVATGKGITWVYHGADAAIPAATLGQRITSGPKSQPYTAGIASGFNGQRPGVHQEITISEHVVQSGVSNQQDSIKYIEGHLKGPFAGLDTEYAGIRINMSAVDCTEPGAAIRGVHLTTTGDGGSAKLRSIRATTIGTNGHDGLITGGMFSAVRGGIIPTSLGGDGVAVYTSGVAGPFGTADCGIISQVGPGIRTAIRAEGFAGKERPQTVFQQGFGAQALLPENAAVQLHGGGNGRVLEVFTDENAGPMIAALGKSGDMTAQAFRSSYTNVSIADDAAVQIQLTRSGGFLFVYSPGSSAIYSGSFIRAVSGASVNISLFAGANMNLGTGALTGTTGTDGNCRVSVDGQSFWIENRSGASRAFVWALIG